MSHEFEIRCTDSDARLVFSGDIPRGLRGDDGCEFEVALRGVSVSAAVTVYDIQPQSWAKFITDISRNWRGWPGRKSQESLEGHLSLAATSDSLGRVSIRVVLRGNMGASDWRAEDTLFLEAGQLERLAREASSFFGRGFKLPLWKDG